MAVVQGKTKYSAKDFPPSATSSTANPTWSGLKKNAGLRREASDQLPELWHGHLRLILDNNLLYFLLYSVDFWITNQCSLQVTTSIEDGLAGVIPFAIKIMFIPTTAQ